MADLDRNARPICFGISGRFQTEWVAELDRNQWPIWSGISINRKKNAFDAIKKFIKKGLPQLLNVTIFLVNIKFIFYEVLAISIGILPKTALSGNGKPGVGTVLPLKPSLLER